MRWTPGGTSDDIEDRRDQSGGGGGGGFGSMRLGLGGVLILFVLSLIFRQNFFALLGGGEGPSTGSTVSGPPDTARDEGEKAVGEVGFFVVRETHKAGGAAFAQQ